MTRFVMSVEGAVRLVIDSAELARGGEAFVTKMPVIRIKDLAEVMIQELAPAYGHDPKKNGIVEIGAKPGEKLYEELMSDEETTRAVELPGYFSILPAFRGLYKDISYDYPEMVSSEIKKSYISLNEEPMSQNELRDYLHKNNLLASINPN